MGDYDLPAAIEYVISSTGYPKIAYVGHSQGTTQLFYGLAHNEDYFADKISVFLAFGPVLQLTHCKSDLLYFFAQHDTLIIDTCELFGIYEFFPANWIDTTFMKLMCGVIPELCEFGIYLICDEDVDLDDSTRLNDYMGHFPSGTSLKSLDHYGQLIQSSQFQYYDFGKKDNQKVYGSDSPPHIAIENIQGKVPIAMFVGAMDELADAIDNEWAYSQMSKAVVFYHEYNLGHLSFMVAKDMSFFTVDAMAIISKF
jgi:lysosomal acid lipase/cholesteryl ester hydrolase